MAAERATPAKKSNGSTPGPEIQVVDPKWLLKVFSLVLLAAILCSYLAMCLLFAMGAWHFVLHPTRKPGNGTGISGELVRFGTDEGGIPQLVGEFLPATSGGSPKAAFTVLYLRPGDGQLDPADAPLITMLQGAGLNVFAFDYRGYGRSAPKPRPSEDRMREDGESAWIYLTGLREIRPDHILIYGAGVGASIAAEIARKHQVISALILRNASADVLGMVEREPRGRLFPVHLLFHERFAMDSVFLLKMPKLLLDIGPNDLGAEEAARQDLYRKAGMPKMTVEIPHDDPAQEAKSLRRFLDEQVKLTPAAQSFEQRPSAR